jgi:hypothetical protein
MKFRFVFWDVLPCKIMMMEAARTSETSVNNYFTRQYIPEDKYEHMQCVYSFIQKYLCQNGNVLETGKYFRLTKTITVSAEATVFLFHRECTHSGARTKYTLPTVVRCTWFGFANLVTARE